MAFIKASRAARDLIVYALGCEVRGVALHKLDEMGTSDSARLPGSRPRMERDGDEWG
jgi:hypothetical protein